MVEFMQQYGTGDGRARGATPTVRLRPDRRPQSPFWDISPLLGIAVETDETLEHPVHAVIEPVRSFDDDSIKDWRARHLAPDAEVFSDGLFCFRRFADAGHAHTVLETGGGRQATEADGARWVNIVLSNVKRALDGG
jgi:hypothetical protein